MTRVEVAAEVTGTVWKIEVQTDARLDDGDTILIVESMKMEIPVVAPASGRLTELKVVEGDSVESGQIVAVIGT